MLRVGVLLLASQKIKPDLLSLVTFVLVGMIMVALAEPLARRKIAPNGLYGFRTPTTLRYPSIWYEVNEHAGKQLRVVGACTAAFAVLLYLSGVNPGFPTATMSIVGALLVVVANQRLASKLRTNLPGFALRAARRR